MSFTRFHDDPNRIKKQVEESITGCNYMLNTPGQGIDLPFFEDPQLRLQKWGSNLRTNTINLESDLLGMTRPTNRDHLTKNDYQRNKAHSTQKYYKNQQPIVDESRASHPAWMYKDLEQTRWEKPLLNPLNGLEKGFHENIQTRILEKDSHTTKIPFVNGINQNNYYLTGNSICISGNEDTCPGTLYSGKMNNAKK